MFEILIRTAAHSLLRLEQPVVVASCPNLHNDAGRYRYWQGVQVGRAYWERSDYRIDGGELEEDICNPGDLVTARETLAWLEDRQWRSKFESDIGRVLILDALALVVQHGVCWLVGPDVPGPGGYIAYRVKPSGELDEIGEAKRIDHRLGEGWPLVFQRIYANAWPSLNEAAPSFPAEMMPLSNEQS